MHLLLKTSMFENLVGKYCYAAKKYNACLLHIHSDVQRQGGSWFAVLIVLDLGC